MKIWQIHWRKFALHFFAPLKIPRCTALKLRVKSAWAGLRLDFTCLCLAIIWGGDAWRKFMKTAVKRGCATGQNAGWPGARCWDPLKGGGVLAWASFLIPLLVLKMCGPTTLGPGATGWSLRELPEAHAVLRRHGDATHGGPSLGTALLVPY